MGKKAKKTKWRTLEIPAPGKDLDGGSKWDDRRHAPSSNYHQHYQYEKTTKWRRASPSASPSMVNSSSFYPSKDSETKVFDEDEYTKITTPRQDVLFKKGYLTRKRVPETISENSSDQNIDGIAQDCCSNNEDFSNYANGDESVQQFMCPGSQSYIDPSALYYGGGYEIYDPYTGNVTVLVGGAAAGQYPSNASCQPILTSVPCRPVPLQSVQWFNPVPSSSDWCCEYSSQSDKRCSTDSQNGSGIGSESSGVPESPPEMIEDPVNGNNGSIFPPSYVYPGYMFGAPIYNMDDANAQYYAPESPGLSSSDLTTSKRRRKKKRRRRTEAEEESESSFDDSNCSRSISSTECMLDSRESQLYEDDLKPNTAFSTSAAVAALHYASLPHANVNAPEFIPAEFSLLNRSSSSSQTQPHPPLTDKAVSDGSELAAKKSSSTGLNVYCKPFDTHRDLTKHDLESVSCSNNSDSGISSPGSEDISKNGFSNKEDKNQNDDTKKKPRSRKSKAKSKSSSEEAKTTIVAETTQKANLGAATKTTLSRRELKKANAREKKELQLLLPPSSPPKQVLKKPARTADKKTKNETVIPTPAVVPKKTDKEAKKADKKLQKKKSRDSLTEIPTKQPEAENPTDDLELSGAAARLEIVEQNNNKVIVNEAAAPLQEDLHPCVDLDPCVDLHPCVDLDPAEDVPPVADQPSPAMLNEYVKIEEKPLLAKLVDVTELRAEPEAPEGLSVIEEISSISEFSSCRETHYTLEEVQLAAEQVVNEVMERAEERVLSSMSCDKLQLPITEAVTKWLNEHGGLPAVVEDALQQQQQHPSDSQSTHADTVATTIESKSKKMKQHCVIC